MANSMSVGGAGHSVPRVPVAVRRGLTRTAAFVVAFSGVAWVADLLV